MVIKMRIFLLFAICLMFINATCNKTKDCFNQSYSFNAYSKIYPDIDSISIGDTLWIALNEATSFIDNKTDKTIDYSKASNLGFGITFDKFIGGNFNNPGTVSAVNKFTTVLKEGIEISSLQPDRIKSFNFIELSNRYKFKVAIIPNQSGIYSVAISDVSNVYRGNDKCTKAKFNISFKNTNQHLNLYQDNRPGYEISEYEKNHMYCFKVY